MNRGAWPVRDFLTCAWMALLMGLGHANAQPITLIVPYGPGGSADLAARAVAEEFSRRSGRPVAVQNVAGSGGRLGADRISSSAPNGETVGIIAGNILRGYGLENQMPPPFEVIATMGALPAVVVVTQNVSASLLRELPRGIALASTGIGTSGQACVQAISDKMNLAGESVAYRGIAPLMTELSAGASPMVACVEMTVALPLLREGKVRALAVANQSRVPALPSVATLSELGVSSNVLWNWYAVVGPAGMTSNVRAQLASVFSQAIAAASPRLQAVGLESLSANAASQVASYESMLRSPSGSVNTPSYASVAQPRPIASTSSEPRWRPLDSNQCSQAQENIRRLYPTCGFIAPEKNLLRRCLDNQIRSMDAFYVLYSGPCRTDRYATSFLEEYASTRRTILKNYEREIGESADADLQTPPSSSCRERMPWLPEGTCQ